MIGMRGAQQRRTELQQEKINQLESEVKELRTIIKALEIKNNENKP